MKSSVSARAVVRPSRFARTVLTGSILAAAAIVVPDAHAQFYAAQYNGLSGASFPVGEDANRTLSIAGGAMYDQADFWDDAGGHGGNFGINLLIPANAPGDNNEFSIHGTGILHVTTTGVYTFRSHTDDASRITLDGRNVVVQGGCCNEASGPGITLQAGSTHFINVTFREGGGGGGGDFYVSKDGGPNFLLGKGGAAQVHPDLNVDQVGFTLAGTVGGTPGLLGSYYVQPGGVNQNRATDLYLAGAPVPVGTFVSSTINYNSDGGLLMSAHLGADGASLTAGGGNGTSDGLLTFSGFVQVLASDDLDLVTPGVQVKFTIDGDDNQRLTLGGLTIMENDGGHGINHWVTGNTDQLAAGTGDNTGGTALVSLPSAGLYSLTAHSHNGTGGAGNGFASLLYSSLGLTNGNVQIMPSNRLFQNTLAAGVPKFWSVGPAIGLWDNGVTTAWRTTNDDGPSNASFATDDTANFGNLNGIGARTVNVSGTVVPNQVIVNNLATNPYTIGGGGVIAGLGTLTKDGPGALTMQGANTFSGNVLIKHGSVSAGTIGDVGAAGNLGQGTGITLGDTAGANDAVLSYTGSTATAARAFSVQSNGGAINVANAGATLTFSGALSGSGTISKTGPGGVNFSAPAGSFTGGLTISGGSLGVTTFASGSGNVALSGGGTFNYAGNTINDGRSLVTNTGGGTITVSNSLARYQVATANNTGGALTVSGPGRLAVTGVANFPTLPTLTANGTLALMNEGGGNILPATLAVSTGTLELANSAFAAGTPLQLDGGTIRLGHEGLQGYYFDTVYNPDDWNAARRDNTAADVRNIFETLGAPAAAARSNMGGQTNLDWGNGNGGAGAPFANQGLAAVDNIRAVWTGKILISNAGLTTFFTTSDDGSAIYIDGQRVVHNLFQQGMTERSGTINLTAGLHDIGLVFNEGTGGGGFIAQYTPQGGTKQVIPNSVLFAGDTYNASTSPVIVNQDSNLEIGADSAALGVMTLNANKTLSIVGSANFAGTALAAAGTAGVNVQNFEGSVNLGPLSGPGTTINKGGPGALVFSATTAGLTINNNAGLVVLQGDGVTNPLAASTINFLGGGLGFSATAGNPTYVSNVVAGTNSYRIEAGRFGGTLATSNVTWAPANNNIAVGSGATATFNIRNGGWTLGVGAPTSGLGAVEVEEGPITFNNTIGNAGGFTVKGANVTANAPINTGAVSLTGSHGNVTTLNPVLTAQDTINATSINVTRGTLNANDTTTNTGAFTQAGGTANFNVASSHGSGAVSGGTANFNGPLTVTGVLTASGNGTLNVRNTATTGATNINTATVNLDMGAGNTRTFNGPININNGTLRAQSGTTDLGSNALAGATTYVAGLTEGVFTNTNDINATTPNPGTGHPGSATGGIQLSPRMGLTGNVQDDTIYGNGYNYWKQNETWVYTGQFFDADGVFTFAENIDDNVSVRVDGVQVIKNDTEDSWRTITNSASASGQRFDNSAGLTVNSGVPNVANNYGPGAEGWHTIEIRFSNGGGGAGAVGDGNVGNHFWGGGDNNAYTRKGFGLNVNGTTSFEGDQYILPIDPGDGSLFRVAQASSTVNIDAGADLRAGSTSGTTAINLNGQSGNPATFRLNNNGALTNSSANRVLVGPGGTPNGAVVVGTNNVFTVGKLSVPGGGSLDVSGPGTLVVTGSVTGSVSAVTTVLDGSLNLNGPGIVRINASVGTSAGTTTVNGGTLGGTGTLAGVVVNGGILAPGQSAGTLTMSSLSLTSSSTIQLELALAGTPGGPNDLLQVNGALTLDGILQVFELPGFTDGTYRIANYTGALTNLTLELSPAFTALHPGSSISTATANQVNLIVIPEPGSLAALLGGMGVLTGLRRLPGAAPNRGSPSI